MNPGPGSLRIVIAFEMLESSDMALAARVDDEGKVEY